MIFQNLGNRIRKKIHDHKGDSIAEVLIALLISSLALVMLASMITSATKMITNSKAKMNDYYTANNSISAYTAPAIPIEVANRSGNSNVTIEITSSDAPTADPLKSLDKNYPVQYYGNYVFQNKPVIIFEKSP